MSNPFLQVAAYRTLDLLRQRRAILFDEGTVFWVWEREDRAVIVFDPNAIELGKVNAQFTHELSTRLNGRRVVKTNSRGLFLQVGYEIPPAKHELLTVELDLSKQVNPLDLPIGETTHGGLWVNLAEGDSFLVAGTRGYGKSRFLHGWIQALLHGGKTLVYAYDGKHGVEFGRYIGRENFTYIGNLGTALNGLLEISMERRKTLLKSGCTSIADYNKTHDESIMPIALIVDEAALITDAERETLVQIVERERDTGFHPIYGTNRPEAATLLVKSNLGTRVCFPVPSWNASQMALGMNGAESLPRIKGRGLIVYQARVLEFQSFAVSVPDAGEQAQQVLDSIASEMDIVDPTAPRDEVAEMAEGIRGQWSLGMRKAAVARLLGFPQTGGSYGRKVDAVVAFLEKTTTTTDTMAQNGAEMPVLGLVGA